MTITLRAEHERLIATAMKTGAYSDPEDVISRALEMLHSEDEWLQDQKGEITAKIDRAFEQFERGEGLSPEQVRAEMDKRKERWLAEQHRS